MGRRHYIQYIVVLIIIIIIIYSLLNVRFGSLLGPRGLLLKYMWGENSDRENPVNHLPAFGTRLLGACLAPAGRLWYSTSLLFLATLGTIAAVTSLRTR